MEKRLKDENILTYKDEIQDYIDNLYEEVSYNDVTYELVTEDFVKKSNHILYYVLKNIK